MINKQDRNYTICNIKLDFFGSLWYNKDRKGGRKLKNIYVATNTGYTAILFSKDMVKKYKKVYPNAKFETVDNLTTAFQKAKPENYFSPKVYAVKSGNIKGICLTAEEYNVFFRGASGWRRS